MKRHAKAIWIGTLKEGAGHLTTESNALNKTEYSWHSRYTAEGKGTNPEELLGAAHSGCFTMKLCALITEEGFIPESIETNAYITFENNSITESHLIVNAKIPGISDEIFQKCATESKLTCP